MTYIMLLGSAVVFISLNHPIGLGLALIVHTLLISVTTGLVGGHFWFSYILFLVFLGGVLVLFIYMTSLASNEKFEVGWEVMMVMFGGVGLLMIGLIITLLPSSECISSMIEWSPQTMFRGGLGALVMKLYSFECFKMTVLLILYLLYALLVCANIVGSYSGSLRNFN